MVERYNCLLKRIYVKFDHEYNTHLVRYSFNMQTLHSLNYAKSTLFAFF